VIVEHDGVVDKFVGDEVVAWFVIPFAGFEHAKAAVEAAKGLVSEAGRATTDRPPIPLGAAVHTGVAYVGSLGEGNVTQFTGLGDNVNATARLASGAAVGRSSSIALQRTARHSTRRRSNHVGSSCVAEASRWMCS
jgi:adenylate cyclase